MTSGAVRGRGIASAALLAGELRDVWGWGVGVATAALLAGELRDVWGGGRGCSNSSASGR